MSSPPKTPPPPGIEIGASTNASSNASNNGEGPSQPPAPPPPRPQQQGDVAPTPMAKGKEKKRVGFASDRDQSTAIIRDGSTSRSRANSPADLARSPRRLTPIDQNPTAEDYFSLSPAGTSANETPVHGLLAAGDRASFNQEELRSALIDILQPELRMEPVPPSRPRPVLRKHTPRSTSPEEADELVKQQPLRSEIEAKNRADRLAVAVRSSSAPVTRQASVLSSPVSSRPASPSDSLGPGPPPPPAGFGLEATVRHDYEPVGGATDQDGLRARKGPSQLASELVRSHTRRAKPSMSMVPLLTQFSRPGTATPVPHDVEYVSRPEKYKGGILGSLLRLYNAEDKQAGGHGGKHSATSTPSRTPNRTPASTPPSSAPASPALERPRSGLFGLRANNSSSTLMGLVGSSTSLAAPASTTDVSGGISWKARFEREKEKEKEKKRKRRLRANPFARKNDDEQYRITVHIAEIISRHQYLIKLCRALMMYGAPTHRLEAYMNMSARVLGIEGQFMYLPGTMLISFDDSNTHTTEVKLVQAMQGVDLGKLRDVHEIYKEVVHDAVSVEPATRRLDDVLDRKAKYPVWVRVVVYGIASASVAPFGFEGRYIDMPICFLLGLLVGFLQLVLSPGNELYANVFEITAAIFTSALARMFGSIHGGTIFCFSSLAQSSIALILPGFLVLCASLELQSHQIIAGSVRMVYALIYSLFLGYGITIGSVIYGYMDSNAVSAVHCTEYKDHWYEQRPPEGSYSLFVLAFTVCLCVVNQAKWRQVPVMAVISLAGYAVNNRSNKFFTGSSQVSNSLGALTVGILANLYSRLGRHVENWWLDAREKHLDPIAHRLLDRVDRIPGRFISRLRSHRLRRRRRRDSNFDFDRPVSDMPMASMPYGGEPDFGLADGELKEGKPQPRASASARADPPHSDSGDGAAGDVHTPDTASPIDLESQQRMPGSMPPAADAAPARHARKIGYGLAAAAMLPAIWVQVPSGLAAGGSLLSGITTADYITRNGTVSSSTPSVSTLGLSNTAFNVLLSVVQVAISISVGLSLSALIVYPFGKRRSGLFSL